MTGWGKYIPAILTAKAPAVIGRGFVFILYTPSANVPPACWASAGINFIRIRLKLNFIIR